ncbi:MAG: glycosyltransferase [Bacteroidetes bacterium]|nr:glycosyltransferase [Bacteroidota bacterium]
MKILHAINNFFPSHQAGTEQYVLSLIQHSIEQGLDCEVVIPQNKIISSAYSFNNIQIHPFVSENISLKNGYARRFLQVEDDFKKVIEKVKPDIVHFHNLNSTFTIHHFNYIKSIGKKVIFTPHLAGTICPKGDFIEKDIKICNGRLKQKKCTSCFYNETNYKNIFAKFLNSASLSGKLPRFFSTFNYIPFRMWQLKKIASCTDHIISIAPWIQEVFRINNIDSLSVPTQFLNAPFEKPPETPEENKKKIIFIGRVYPIKGLDFLLSTIEKYNLSNQIELTVISPIAEKNEYYTKTKSQFARLGFTEWKENLRREGVLKEMANHSLLIAPSRSEMNPLVIHEALSVNIPIIASNIPAFTDLIIHNENGWLFDLFNDRQLKDLITDFVSERINLKHEKFKPKRYENHNKEMIHIYTRTCSAATNTNSNLDS